LGRKTCQNCRGSGTYLGKVCLVCRVADFFKKWTGIFSFVAMLCSICLLLCNIYYVWLPSIRFPQLEVEWSSSWGVKVAENRLNLANQSQSRPVNITLEVYNTGNAPAHNVGVSFDYTTEVGCYDYLLIYENNRYQTITYRNSYQQGLLQEGNYFSVIVFFRVSFYGIWTTSSKPTLNFQIFSTELPTINVEIEIQLV